MMENWTTDSSCSHNSTQLFKNAAHFLFTVKIFKNAEFTQKCRKCRAAAQPKSKCVRQLPNPNMFELRLLTPNTKI